MEAARERRGLAEAQAMGAGELASVEEAGMA
jgi:hypothetical protein